MKIVEMELNVAEREDIIAARKEASIIPLTPKKYIYTDMCFFFRVQPPTWTRQETFAHRIPNFLIGLCDTTTH